MTHALALLGLRASVSSPMQAKPGARAFVVDELVEKTGPEGS